MTQRLFDLPAVTMQMSGKSSVLNEALRRLLIPAHKHMCSY